MMTFANRSFAAVIGTLVLAIALIVSACSEAGSPTGTNLGQIKGTVVTAAGEPVQGALVRTVPVTSEQRTDETGRFLIPVVPVGDYTITAASGTQQGSVKATITERQNTLVTIVLGRDDSSNGDDDGNDDDGKDDDGKDDDGKDDDGKDDDGNDDDGNDDGGNDDGGGGRPDLPMGIIAFLPLDGNANDLTQNLPPGRIQGAQRTTNRLGIPGLAMYFSGNADFVEVPIPRDRSLLNLPMSWSFWLRPDRTSGAYDGMYQAPLGIYVHPMMDGFVCAWQPQGFTAQYAAGEDHVAKGSAPLPRDGNWHHVVVVVVETGMQFWIDGRLAGAGQWRGMPMVSKAPHPLRLGTMISQRKDANTPQVKPYAGAIDDVMVFNRALNPVEIQALSRF